MDTATLQTLSLLVAFGLIALASDRIGLFFRRWRLPLITGFLFTGILAGPYALDLIRRETVAELRFVDQLSLAVIAFAAGNELYMKELRSRLRAIAWITSGLVISTFLLGTLAFVILGDVIPFLEPLPLPGRIAVAMIGGAILVARSPSSAIAIVNELRARGPFTKTALGVTVVMDIAVIVVFSVCFSVASGLLSDEPFQASSIALLAGELAGAVGLGWLLGWLLHQLIKHTHGRAARIMGVLLLGYGVFAGSEQLRLWSHEQLAVSIHLEPLLICMLASFYATNFTPSHRAFSDLLHRICAPIYVAFFTLTGASLELDVLPGTWHIALALFAVRLVGIIIGSRIGASIAGEPPRHRRIAWMAFITQAGVALGLAKNVADAYPEWGPSFATTIVALIVFNQVVGPPLLKWAIGIAGEDRSRGDTPAFDGTRDALICGVDGQALALARVLVDNGWNVKIASRQETEKRQLGELDVWLHPVERYDLETLRELGIEGVDALVVLKDDETNLRICELAFQNFGTRALIVRLGDTSYRERFQELGAIIIDPRSAVVSLLERAVRSPTSATLMLGLDDVRDIVDVEVGNGDLAGLMVRELRMPLDVALLYVHRDGSMVPSTGNTLLQLGDRVTLSGPVPSLEKVIRKIEG